LKLCGKTLGHPVDGIEAARPSPPDRKAHGLTQNKNMRRTKQMPSAGNMADAYQKTA
jgi:hypothetical protein